MSGGYTPHRWLRNCIYILDDNGRSYTPHRWLRKSSSRDTVRAERYTPHRWLRKQKISCRSTTKNVIHRIGGLEKANNTAKYILKGYTPQGGLEIKDSDVSDQDMSYTPHRWLRKSRLCFCYSRDCYTPHRWLRKVAAV